MYKNKLLLGVAAVAILLGGYWAGASFGLKGDTDKEQTAAPLPVVKASDRVAAEGVLLPIKSVGLSFAVGGVVAQVPVKTGDQVKQGQLLVQLENDELKARLNQAQANLAKAQDNLNNLKAGPRPQELVIGQAAVDQAGFNFEAAKTALDRIRQLNEAGGASQQELEQAETAFKSAEAALRQARAQLDLTRSGERPATIKAAESDVKAAAMGVAQLNAALSQTELRAPFSGTVASIDLRPGQFVSPGTPIVQLADFSAWQVKTEDLTELGISQVKVGNRARITFDAVPGLELTGVVSEVASYGERIKGDMTYSARVRLDSFDQRLRWNMTASVEITPAQN